MLSLKNVHPRQKNLHRYFNRKSSLIDHIIDASANIAIVKSFHRMGNRKIPATRTGDLSRKCINSMFQLDILVIYIAEAPGRYYDTIDGVNADVSRGSDVADNDVNVAGF